MFANFIIKLTKQPQKHKDGILRERHEHATQNCADQVAQMLIR